jgi:hypothetical protein
MKVRILGNADIIFIGGLAKEDIYSATHSTNKGGFGAAFGVENTGVEPVTSCMPCKRSSQLS